MNIDNLKTISDDVIIGTNVVIHQFVNAYGCNIGDDSRIGPFTEIQKGVIIGKRCKIQSHSFICEGVTIEDEVFIGHGVMFTNDKFPQATTNSGEMKSESDWECMETLVKKGASIGSNATILPGVTIGEHAIVGAGSVVTKNVAAHSIVVGVPAKERG